MKDGGRSVTIAGPHFFNNCKHKHIKNRNRKNSKNTEATIDTKDYHVPLEAFLAAAIVKGRDKPLN